MLHESKELIFDGVVVNIIFKKNKHSYLKLKKDASVQLTVPYNITLTSIQDILSKSIPKLKSKISAILLRQNDQSLSTIRYLGVDLNRLEIEPLIQTKSELTLWYKSQALLVFNERYNHCLSLVKSFNIARIPQLKIRRMTTRFGSYSRHTHTITLSLWLIKFPLELIDYVIYHELTHLVHFNHSRDFYQLLESICPHWKVYKQELKQLSDLYGFAD